MRHLIAAMKASLSEVENWRHSNRTLGLALHAASAGDTAVAAVASSWNCTRFADLEEWLNPLGRSFPASKSDSGSNFALGNADAGSAGASLGCRIAPDIKEGARSSKTSDCMVGERY